MTKDPNAPRSASELLAGWRSAERDTAAAVSAAGVAALALVAAEAAEDAAAEVEAAAEAAAEAVDRARTAAQRARTAARQAADAAKLAMATAEGDETRTTLSVEDARAAETTARDRYHDAEGKGFPTE